MPYIDLVNEIFEYYIAHNALDANAAYDTGSANTGAAYLFEGAALAFAASGAGPHDLTLRRNGVTLELFDNTSSKVVRSSFLAETKSALVVAAPGQSNTLTLDLASGGSFDLPGGILFEGGAGGTDVLRLLGASQATLGRTHLAGFGLPTVRFSALEGVSLVGTAGELISS